MHKFMLLWLLNSSSWTVYYSLHYIGWCYSVYTRLEEDKLRVRYENQLNSGRHIRLESRSLSKYRHLSTFSPSKVPGFELLPEFRRILLTALVAMQCITLLLNRNGRSISTTVYRPTIAWLKVVSVLVNWLTLKVIRTLIARLISNPQV